MASFELDKEPFSLRVNIDRDFLRIPEIGYLGWYHISASEEWVISWMAGSPPEPADDLEGVAGAFVLYNSKTKAVILHGGIEHPRFGKVSDSGTFFLVDQSFCSSGLSFIHVVDAKGDVKISRSFVPSVEIIALSKKGRYAACQTGGSSKQTDGRKIFLYDLRSCQEVYRIRPKTHYTNYLSIEDESGRLVAHERGMGEFRYGLDGVFLHEAEYKKTCLETGDVGWIIWDILEQHKSGAMSQNSASEALRILRCAEETGAANGSNAAFWYAALGKTLDALGDLDGALTAFECALEKFPLVGVKRRANALRKLLQR